MADITLPDVMFFKVKDVVNSCSIVAVQTNSGLDKLVQNRNGLSVKQIFSNGPARLRFNSAQEQFLEQFKN